MKGSNSCESREALSHLRKEAMCDGRNRLTQELKAQGIFLILSYSVLDRIM